MTLRQTKKYLSGLSLVEALWWFIDNVGSDSKQRSDLFFYLRERMRTETNPL